MFKTYFLLPLLIPPALMKRDFSGGLLRRVERWAARFAAKPARAVALVGIVSFLLNMSLSLCTRIPAPHVSDEFGYLLLGDTFAHGRVTNPTPPLWEHFETINEVMRPTYTAKYPPAQGVALAVGEWLGLPIIGVWLTTALACAATCWMFMAWMPPRWALAGGLMVALHPQVLEWSQDYWGGAVAMGGGALVSGAFRRILRAPRARDAVWMGIGLGLLANSRPYEGCVFGVLTGAALVIGLVKHGAAPASVVFQRLFCPLAAVLLLFGAEVCFYNWRVTGSAVVMPYVLHEETYGIAPVFLFGKPHPEPQYRHREIRKLQENYLAYYESQRRSVRALLGATGQKIWTLAQGYLWSYLMVVALLALPCALARDRWLWFPLAIGVCFSLAMLMGTWVFPHYAAPAAGLFFVLAVQSMRSLRAWHIGTRRIGRAIVRALAILFVLSLFHIAVKMAAPDTEEWYVQRQALLRKLMTQPGKSVVVVKYDAAHNPHREWIYNDADIPGAKVILARDMGEKNQELLEYFKDRKAWVIHADSQKPELEPYPGF